MHYTIQLRAVWGGRGSGLTWLVFFANVCVWAEDHSPTFPRRFFTACQLPRTYGGDTPHAYTHAHGNCHAKQSHTHAHQEGSPRGLMLTIETSLNNSPRIGLGNSWLLTLVKINLS